MTNLSMSTLIDYQDDAIAAINQQVLNEFEDETSRKRLQLRSSLGMYGSTVSTEGHQATPSSEAMSPRTPFGNYLQEQALEVSLPYEHVILKHWSIH